MLSLFTKKKILSLLIIAALSGIIGLFSLSSKARKTVTGFLNNTPVPSSKIPPKRAYPINRSISPCVNFYEYTCSSVIHDFKLREDRSIHHFAFDDARERLLELKKKYLISLIQQTPKSAMEEEIKNYYLACMNLSSRQKEEQALVKQTKELLNKITTKKEFFNLIANNLTDPSRLSFIDFNIVTPDLYRPNYNDLFFDTHLITLPEKSYYQNKQLMQELKELIQQFFISIGESSPQQKANWIVRFEQELVQHYPSPRKYMERLNSRTNISKKTLVQNYPYLKLEKFLVRIPKTVVIRNIIGTPTMEFFNQKLKTTSLEELKSIYLYFQLAPIMDDAYPEFFTKQFEFRKKYLGGPVKRPERQERCTNITMRDFTKEVDFILLPKIFPNFPKEKFISLIEKIRATLLTQLKTNTWLTANTKREAIRKIKQVKFLLVSPNNEEEWDFNPRTTYAIDAPIANSYKLQKLLTDKKLQELAGPMNTKRWTIGPLNVDAFYDPSYNQIVLPIGILQYPIYDPTEPEEVNLGVIGTIVGHELGHALDNYGSKFNADGVLKTWMTAKDKKIFNNKTRSLITQFNRIGHDGKLTLAENIGDLVGLTTSYQAAFPQGSSDKNQEPKKRFFLQYTRLWCEIQRKDYATLNLKTNPHALGYARANEQVKQQLGFQEAYNCKPGDPMVIPEKERVKIW